MKLTKYLYYLFVLLLTSCATTKYTNLADTKRINILSKEKIQFQLCKADSVIDSQEVTGHIKDGYFYRTPYFILSPFVPIFFGYTSDKYRIGLVENKLIVDNNSRYWWFFFAAGG